jgi:hypothetical protein
MRPLPRPRGLAPVPDVQPADGFDTMTDLPAAAAQSSPSEVPPPRQSESRALSGRTPPRPAPRPQPEAKQATTTRPPPPLPVALKSVEPAAASRETDTMELDPACIEEVRALASAAPPLPASPSRARTSLLRSVAALRGVVVSILGLVAALLLSAISLLGPVGALVLERAMQKSRGVLTFVRAVAFWSVYTSTAAMGWLRASLFPATRAAAADARDRLVIEWARASSRAREGGSPNGR